MVPVLSRDPAVFNSAVEDILEEVIHELESSAKEYSALGEDGISSVLVTGVNGRNGVRAFREMNSNGHVDITIKSTLRPTNQLLGEAKIYNGPRYHVEGMDQLLNRYTTGRFPYAFMVEYVRNTAVKTACQKIRDHLDEHRPFAQLCDCKDHQIVWSFCSTHEHKSASKITVLHLSVHLPTDKKIEAKL